MLYDLTGIDVPQLLGSANRTVDDLQQVGAARGCWRHVSWGGFELSLFSFHSLAALDGDEWFTLHEVERHSNHLSTGPGLRTREGVETPPLTSPPAGRLPAGGRGLLSQHPATQPGRRHRRAGRQRQASAAAAAPRCLLAHAWDETPVPPGSQPPTSAPAVHCCLLRPGAAGLQRGPAGGCAWLPSWPPPHHLLHLLTVCRPPARLLVPPCFLAAPWRPRFPTSASTPPGWQPRRTPAVRC